MADRIFAFFLIGLWAFVWYISRDYPFKSNIVPWGVTGFVALLSFFFIVKPEPIGKVSKLGQIFLFFIAMLIAPASALLTIALSCTFALILTGPQKVHVSMIHQVVFHR